MARESHFPVSLFATPSATEQELFYTVPRAGHLVGGPDHHVKRDHFPGHELILCLRGRGFVRVQGRSHPVSPGQLVWVDCRQPHEHGAVADDPWEVYWVRAEGLQLARMAEALRVAASPVFPGFDVPAAVPLYREVFARLDDVGATTAPLVHAAVARLVALAFVSRQAHGGPPQLTPSVLHRAVQKMKLFYFEQHRVAALAALCGVSPSHFNRLFRATFGTSPIDWLRRERISQAKRRLMTTTDSVKRIAEQVGYRDRFFFSKDFKRMTGLTPRQFRQREALTRA